MGVSFTCADVGKVRSGIYIHSVTPTILLKSEFIMFYPCFREWNYKACEMRDRCQNGEITEGEFENICIADLRTESIILNDIGSPERKLPMTYIINLRPYIRSLYSHIECFLERIRSYPLAVYLCEYYQPVFAAAYLR